MGSEEAAARSMQMDLESKRLRKGYQMNNELNLLGYHWTVQQQSWNCGHVWSGQKKEMKTGESNLSCCHALRRRVHLRPLWRQKLNSCLKESLFVPILCVYRLIRNSEADHSCILRYQVRPMTTHLIQTLRKTDREKDWMLNCIPAWLLHTRFSLAFAAVQKFNIKDYSIRDQLFL